MTAGAGRLDQVAASDGRLAETRTLPAAPAPHTVQVAEVWRDHKKPGAARLTLDHLRQHGLSVNDPTDDSWLRTERARIGRRVRDFRMDGDLTQERVYLAAGLNRSFYQGIEGGLENPTLEVLLRIARAIGVPLSDLVR